MSKRRRGRTDERPTKTPSRRRRRSSHEEGEEETPVTSHRPRRGREKEEKPISRKGKRGGGKAKPKSTGWGRVKDKQAEKEAFSDTDEDRPRDFWLKDGEYAFIQVLDAEPWVYDSHGVRDKRGDYKVEPCQLENQDHCLMCMDGIYRKTSGTMLVLDYRGSWDKKKKDFKWDEPVEKLWTVGLKMLGQLHGYMEKRGVEGLDELVIDISRTGSDTSTTYNLERAYEDDELLKPLDWDRKALPTEEYCIPRTDEELEARGFEDKDD